MKVILKNYSLLIKAIPIKLMKISVYIRLAIILGFVGLVGCSLTKLGVEPWQRATLAKDSMRLNHFDLQSSFDDHIYYAREASTGGSGSGGGGCGCN